MQETISECRSCHKWRICNTLDRTRGTACSEYRITPSQGYDISQKNNTSGSSPQMLPGKEQE